MLKVCRCLGVNASNYTFNVDKCGSVYSVFIHYVSWCPTLHANNTINTLGWPDTLYCNNAQLKIHWKTWRWHILLLRFALHCSHCCAWLLLLVLCLTTYQDSKNIQPCPAQTFTHARVHAPSLMRVSGQAYNLFEVGSTMQMTSYPLRNVHIIWWRKWLYGDFALKRFLVECAVLRFRARQTREEGEREEKREQRRGKEGAQYIIIEIWLFC